MMDYSTWNSLVISRVIITYAAILSTDVFV